MTTNDSLLLIHSQIDELNQQAQTQFNEGQLEIAYQLCSEVITLASEYKYKSGIGYALGIKGRVLFKLVRMSEAVDVFNQALDIFQEIGDSLQIARSLQGLATVKYGTGRLNEALEEYLNAFSVLELAGLQEQSLAILGNIVLVYHSLGDFFNAIQYSQQRLTLARHYNSDFDIAQSLENLGELHFRLADYETSLNYSHEGLAIAIENKNLTTESGILANIGAVYYFLGNYTSALDYMMRGIAVGEQLKNERFLAPLYNFVCCVYGKMKNDSLALNYAMRALSIHTTYAEPAGEAYTLHNIASIFEQSGDIPTALEYAQKSRSIFIATSIKEGEAESLVLIAACNEKLGDHQAAFDYAKDSLSIAESINSHTILQSSLRQLISSATHNGDKVSVEKYTHRLTLASKIIAKEEQRKKAEKLLLDAQIKKTQEQAQLLIASAKSSLSGDFLTKTNSLRQRGFIVAASATPDTTKKTKTSSLITVHTFGYFSVKIGNRELKGDDWQRKKARDIFKILLINHRKSVTIDELIDFLWADSGSKNLIPTLWNSVSYIRKALEPDIKPHTPSSYIKIMDKAYMLDLGADVSIDFLQFKSLIAASHKEKNMENKVSMLVQATALYNGDFLKEDSFEEWASYERESMKELFLEATMKIGNYYLGIGKISESIMYARKAIETDKVYEDGYELLFKSLVENQQFSELTKAWKLCQSAYKKEIGSNPPKFLEKLTFV